MAVLNEEKIGSFLNDPFEQAAVEARDSLVAAQAAEPEGQLSVDVSEDGNYYFIHALVAAVKPEDLEVSYSDSVLTIRGRRHRETELADKNFLFQECFWGSFSRSIGLPASVNPNAIQASVKNGILTVIIPKI